MIIEKGLLKGFNSTDYTAAVMLTGSFKTFMEKVVVARSIPSSAMTAGRRVVILFFDSYSCRDALIIAAYD
ncbi:MAG: hypothetical protein GX226_03300 [Dehalococcoidales bacterium]|jgi:hypothetical protein|nr:hypothetical protein [Dehalococcoidales bacterium]